MMKFATSQSLEPVLEVPTDSGLMSAIRQRPIPGRNTVRLDVLVMVIAT